MLKRLARFTGFIVARAQKVLLSVFLFVIYIAGLGCTLLFLAVFNRKVFSGRYERAGSYWHKARGYGSEEQGCRQA